MCVSSVCVCVVCGVCGCVVWCGVVSVCVRGSVSVCVWCVDSRPDVEQSLNPPECCSRRLCLCVCCCALQGLVLVQVMWTLRYSALRSLRRRCPRPRPNQCWSNAASSSCL